MTANAVGNVLGILRLLRSGDYGNPIVQHVSDWCGGPIDPIKVAKVAGYVLENVEAAEGQINLSQLTVEAKQGLLQTTGSLKSAFLFSHMNNSLQSFFPALDTSVTSFAILASAWGFSDFPIAADEIASLVSDIQATCATLDDVDIHPLVRETAKRHISVLLALLSNAQALGVDAAMAAYFELLVHLRRADQSIPEDQQQGTKPLWDKVKEWGARITTISEIANKGGSLLTQAEKLVPLLQSFMR